MLPAILPTMEKLDAMLAACKNGDIHRVQHLLKADATLATASAC